MSVTIAATVRTTEEMLSGAVDLDCRSGAGHDLDQVEAAGQALELGLAGILFRDPGYCTAPISALLTETYFRDRPLAIMGSVTLNNVSGGLNVYAAEHNLMLGGRLICMPTLSSAFTLRAANWPRPATTAKLPKPLTVLGPRQTIPDEVREILDLVAARDAVLCAGHLHVSEILPLFVEAKARGVSRLLLSDPVLRNGAMAKEVIDLVDMGAAVEFAAQPRATTASLAQILANSGRLILGLDTGEIATSLRQRYAAALTFWRDIGLGQKTIRSGVADNPRALLGI